LKEFNGWLNRNKLGFNPGDTGSSFLLEAQYGRKIDGEINFARSALESCSTKSQRSKRADGFWRGIR
jgi:hypothetical protein